MNPGLTFKDLPKLVFDEEPDCWDSRQFEYFKDIRLRRIKSVRYTCERCNTRNKLECYFLASVDWHLAAIDDIRAICKHCVHQLKALYAKPPVLLTKDQAAIAKARLAAHRRLKVSKRHKFSDDLHFN